MILRVKQRWLFNRSNMEYIMEITDVNVNYVTVKIIQILSLYASGKVGDVYTSNGLYMINRGTSPSRVELTYLENQDAP